MHLSERISLTAYIELCRILRVPTRPFTPDDTIVGRDSYGSGLHGSERRGVANPIVAYGAHLGSGPRRGHPRRT